MSDQEFINQFRDAIDIDSDIPLTLATELESAPWWDSLSVISTISMLATEFGVITSAREVNQCFTISEIKSLSERRK